MSELKLPKMLTVDQIKEDQDGIKKDLTALDLRIWNNMIQCLLHCQEHRDTSLFTRLLTEIVAVDENGYRRQSMIAWMKVVSPMRLSENKTIKLTGKGSDGKEQPFNIELAISTPFWKMVTEGKPELKPIFQDGPLGTINRTIKAFQSAVANTNVETGQPIDASKPFYLGKNVEALNNFMVSIKQLEAVIPVDDTKDVVTAKAKQSKLAA